MMAGLRHDAQGFLQGDAIDIGQMLSSLNSIKADVHAIQRALGMAARASGSGTRGGAGGVQGGNPSPSSGSGAPPSPTPRPEPASPSGRDSRGRFIRREPAPADGPAAPGRRAGGAGAAGGAPALPGGRDGRGRFTGGDSPSGPDGTPSEGMFRSFFDRLSGTISGNALEQADPAVKAFQEVAQPLAAGYGMLTGNREEKKKEGWFRRIYSSLTGFRKDDSVFNRAANRSLRNLEDAPAAGGGDGQGGFAGLVAGITSRVLPLLGMLFTRLLLPVAAAIGAWKVGQWIGEKIYAWMDEKGINTIIFDAFDGAKAYISKGWDGAISLWKSMGEGMGKAWDFVMGLFSSAYQGLKSLPIIGAAISMAENAVAKIKDVAASATETTKRAASGAASGVKQAASEVVAGAKQGYSGESQAGAGRGSINPPMANGGSAQLDTRSMATKVGQAAGGAAKQVVGGAKAVKKKTAEYWQDARQHLIEASDQAGVDVGVLAKIARFESGFNSNNAPISRSDPSKNKVTQFDGRKAISSAHGYGQFLDDTWIETLNKHGAKYGVEGAGKLNKEQAAKFRNDKGIQAAMLAEFTKENIAKGRKYGGQDDDANVYAFHNLGDGDAKKLLKGMQANPAATVRDSLLNGTKSEKERARVESVIAGNRSLYGNGNITAADAYGRMGQVMREGEVFATDARRGARVAPVAAPVAQTVHAPAARAPSISARPALADAPPIITPLGTGGGKTQIKVTLPAQDVGQDVKARGVAHIVTGGYGGA